MITYTGESVWPRGSEYDTGEVPSLKSIGIGLGRIVRFAGQTKRFYTVLPHTFTVADLVPIEHEVYALLHDAPEAIVGDVPTTWKTDAARLQEEDLLERITRHLGLPWPWPEDAQHSVKLADYEALCAEAHVLGHAAAEEYWPRIGVSDQAIGLTKDHILFVREWLEPTISGREYSDRVEQALSRWTEHCTS